MAISTCLPTESFAQYNEIRSNAIKSLQVVAGNDWLSMPIVKLGENTPINIAFDHLTHETHRFAYRIEHCEADWSVSDGVFESDYCDGFADGNIIENSHESLNTNTQYTHYAFSIPNENCKPKLSGNYKVSIYDENNGDTVAVARFMVVEPVVGIDASITANTDIDTNKSHQQLAMKICLNGLYITNPLREIKTVVLQNACWNDARRNVAPQSFGQECLEWAHNKSLIFDGGNEYHKFEILDVTHPTLGVENMTWNGTEYIAVLWPDYPRANYVYDEDANGAFYIRNSDNMENDVASEYVNVKFRFASHPLGTPIFIDGNWTNGKLDDTYEMTYNNATGEYEACIQLKQGYYSYRYVTTDTANTSIKHLPVDGNFHQTSNDYQILVYCHKTGERTDRLVGFRRMPTK